MRGNRAPPPAFSILTWVGNGVTIKTPPVNLPDKFSANNRCKLFFAVWLIVPVLIALASCAEQGTAANAGSPPADFADLPPPEPPPSPPPVPVKVTPQLIAKLTQVFRFATDPPEARAIGLKYQGMGKRRDSLIEVLPAIPIYRSGGPALISPSGVLAVAWGGYFIYVGIDSASGQPVSIVEVNNVHYNYDGSQSPGPHYNDDGSQSFGTYQFAEEGDGDENILRALVTLAGMDEVKQGSFEPRFFQCGSVPRSGMFHAIWLRSPNGDADLVYTLSPMFDKSSTLLPFGLKAWTLYKAADFTDTIRTTREADIKAEAVGQPSAYEIENGHPGRNSVSSPTDSVVLPQRAPPPPPPRSPTSVTPAPNPNPNDVLEC